MPYLNQSSMAEVHPSFNGLLESFRKYPDRIAMIDKQDKAYTYAEFSQHIGWCVEMLQKKKVKKGTRVLVAVPMSMELYALMEALFSMGAVIIFLDPWLKGKQMAGIIKQVRPEVFIATRKIRWFAYLMPATWRIKRWWSFKTIGKSKQPWSIAPVSDDDVALITFTGGTGGIPKGADRSFGFLKAQLDALESHMKSDTDEAWVDYTNFPIVGLADFAMGNQLVIPKINLMKVHEAEAGTVIDTIKKHKVNRTITSPSLLLKIQEGMRKNSHDDEVKHIITGGAPIPYSLIDSLQAERPQTEQEAIYGSTEAEPIAMTHFSSMIEKMSDPLKGIFSGQPVDEVDLKLIQITDTSLAGKVNQWEMPADEIGEVVVSGGHVNKSYFENEAAFKECKIQEPGGKTWHRTGDLGYLNADGLYLVGRIHRVVQHEGKSYHPYPIEFYLERTLGVKDCGYLQLPSKEIVLVIGQQESASEADIKASIEAAGYPIDRVIRYKEKLPRDARHRSKLSVKPLIAELS